jgi:hypothetical protein
MPQGGAEVVDAGRELALDLPRARDDEREKRETRLHNRSRIDMVRRGSTVRIRQRALQRRRR